MFFKSVLLIHIVICCQEEPLSAEERLSKQEFGESEPKAEAQNTLLSLKAMNFSTSSSKSSNSTLRFSQATSNAHNIDNMPKTVDNIRLTTCWKTPKQLRIRKHRQHGLHQHAPTQTRLRPEENSPKTSDIVRDTETRMQTTFRHHACDF